MKTFLTFAFLFYVGSGFGWILELFYRRLFSAKRWLNPGFLIGPYLPIYGFGLCLLYLLSSLDLSAVSNPVWHIVIRILLIGLVMTAVEYLAGKIFIVWMKVKLWDYSDRPGNLDGIICPLFSLIWTLLGAGYSFFLHPFVADAVSWFFSNLAFSFVIGFFFGIFTIDFVYSARLLTKIRTFAKKNHIIVRLEELKCNVREHIEKAKPIHFIFAFRGNRSVNENLKEYLRDLPILKTIRKKAKETKRRK